MIATRTNLVVGRRALSLSNLDKVMYPETGFTKADVIDYYRRIAPVLLPHLKHRPVTLKRYPNGVRGRHFYEKNCPSHRPQWITTLPVKVEKGRRSINLCVIDSVAALMWVANLASLELHAYLFRAAAVERPTMLVFDLDPGAPASLLDCARVGLRLRELLAEADLQCFAKTSGGKGLHVCAPLNTKVNFEQTKAFARAAARTLAQDDPQRVTDNMRKHQRVEKVFVDWSQNEAHKTTVSVYSLRARARPTVSMPVSWDELAERCAQRNADPQCLSFEADEALRRVEQQGDLFEPVLRLKQSLPEEG